MTKDLLRNSIFFSLTIALAIAARTAAAQEAGEPIAAQGEVTRNVPTPGTFPEPIPLQPGPKLPGKIYLEEESFGLGSDGQVRRCEKELRRLISISNDSSISVAKRLANITINNVDGNDVLVFRKDGSVRMKERGGCFHSTGDGNTTGGGVSMALTRLKPKAYNLKPYLAKRHNGPQINSARLTREDAYRLAVAECSAAYKDVFVEHGQQHGQTSADRYPVPVQSSKSNSAE